VSFAPAEFTVSRVFVGDEAKTGGCSRRELEYALAWVLHDSPFLSGDKELTKSSMCRIVAGTISSRPEVSRVKLIPPPMFKEFPMAGDGEQLVGWGLRSTWVRGVVGVMSVG
jgi:hypothetical protein